MMAAVKGRNTGPEKYVRSALFRKGFRYRLHRRDLPGNPDIILPRYRTVIFVHGCFWHGHDCSRGRQRPATRRAFWDAKLDGNISRDRANQATLEAAGWTVFVLWACQLADDTSRLLNFLSRQRAHQVLSCNNPLNRSGEVVGEEAG
jgi:DNA mismatch endonuclease, patch repair protein